MKRSKEKKLDIPEFITASEAESMKMLDALTAEEQELQVLYHQLTTAEKMDDYEEQVLATVKSAKRTSANLAKAHKKSISMGDELAARWHDLTKGKNRKWLPAAPANSRIDLSESQVDHFAKGINIYKVMLLLFIGSFAGVIIEMLWCLITRGYIASRAGLVWGPFNLLYGVGAVALTLPLYRYRNKGSWISFLGGFAVGSIVEYVCSWGQELVFGSRSWDYSGVPFNINGRICLLYSIFWGFLGILWIKSIYPWMAKLILKIPNCAGKIITWVLVIFLAVNGIVSSFAVYRWSERVDNVPASNSFWEYVDERFPDERMERIYENMVFD